MLLAFSAVMNWWTVVHLVKLKLQVNNRVLRFLFAHEYFFFLFKVNGNWSEWQEWEPCSRSCGVGEQYRFRTCDNPAPSGGGKKCEGSEAEMQPCNVQSCQGLYIKYVT